MVPEPRNGSVVCGGTKVNGQTANRIIRKGRVMFALVLVAWGIIQVSTHPLTWGFDIQGGSRVVLRPSNQSVAIEDVTSVIQNRLNIYGLRDMKVRGASDLASSYVVVEAAGLSESEIQSLLASEGYFEGKINNATIFTGKDVKVNTAEIKIQRSSSGGYGYSIPVLLSPEASRRFAQATEFLFPAGTGEHLDKPLELYIDNVLQQSLQISSDLRGLDVPSASVTGGASTRDEAMTRLKLVKAILMTGSIPTKMEIVSIQGVSPTLGSEFLKSTIVAGLVALLLVAAVIFIRYKKLDLAFLVTMTTVFEVVIIFGVASLINWQFDLSSIAGLIVAFGTGVDQQIIITDEIIRGEVVKASSKSKIKEAMFVIVAAFGTMLAAMLPLMFIGVGAVRGFAVTTLIDVVVGYFVTRPAYMAAIDEVL
jgi:preprotein translocase subunit SecD